MPEEQLQTPVSATVTFDDESRDHLKTADHALTIAQSFEIETFDDCQAAVDERNTNLKELEWLEKRLEFVLSPFTEGVKRVRELFRPRMDARRAAIAYLNPLITNWQLEQQRKIDAENAKREAEIREARQKAEVAAAAEIARANQEAAQKRAEAEAQEKARQQAIDDGNAEAAQEAARKAAELREQAEHVVETSNAQVAQATLEAAAAVSTPVAQTQTLAGQQLRSKWGAEILPTTTEELSLIAVCSAIADGSRMDLMGVLKFDLPALHKMAQALKNRMSVPGWVAVNKPISAGSKK